ncbi:DUF3040 domain-containing protein [Streptomyces spiramyceticus]|uniref:DUF3040 domain-containing protein n=1 Tax=Streptomyces spiramyceticus TaxID=299717 RepID=UPI00237A24F4|nr:DUF3040 domain-containing protein [Streptomyces spiramyceticus]
MDGAGLSDHEQRILAEIEGKLQGDDQTLDRRLRTMRSRHLPHIPPVRIRARGLAICLMGAISAALLIAASTTVKPAFLWAFAAAWIITFVSAVPVFGRWCLRWRKKPPRGGGERS